MLTLSLLNHPNLLKCGLFRIWSTSQCKRGKGRVAQVHGPLGFKVHLWQGREWSCCPPPFFLHCPCGLRYLRFQGSENPSGMHSKHRLWKWLKSTKWISLLKYYSLLQKKVEIFRKKWLQGTFSHAACWLMLLQQGSMESTPAFVSTKITYTAALLSD